MRQRVLYLKPERETYAFNGASGSMELPDRGLIHYRMVES